MGYLNDIYKRRYNWANTKKTIEGIIYEKYPKITAVQGIKDFEDILFIDIRLLGEMTNRKIMEANIVFVVDHLRRTIRITKNRWGVITNEYKWETFLSVLNGLL